MKRHYIESGRAFINGMGKSGFKGATSDKRYLQILKYIGDHDGCTKMDILRGIGSNNFGAGQYSDMFSALKIAGLIDYDRKNNEYHITEEGDEILKNSYLNDMERIVTGRKKFESTSEGLEWLNTFKKAQDFVDKACEQLEIVAFEGGADVGNPIHRKLLRIWSEMRDVVKTIPKDSGAIKESTKKFGRKFNESDEWDDAIFKPSNELQKLYKQLKARYERGDIEIRLADMQFGTFWLVVEVPEDDVKTLDKMEKILKSKCEGNENWEVFREEHLYGDVSKVAIQEKRPKEDKEDEERPVSEPKPPFLGIKGTQDHGTFIMYRNAAIEKDELFEGIQAMLDDEGIDASAEDWASDPKNKRVIRDFLVDYARFANDY